MNISVESLETPALTKAQLADLLFEQIGLNKRESKDMVDAFFDLISDSLVEGDDVKISGFGNFQIRTKAPRPGRNPRDPGAPCGYVSCQPQAQGTNPGPGTVPGVGVVDLCVALMLAVQLLLYRPAWLRVTSMTFLLEL